VNEDCLKLTVYFGERKRAGHRFVADALLDLYEQHEIATSILLRGVEGFGLKHHLRTDSSLTLSEDLPAVAVAVDTRQRIEALLGEATELTRNGLVTLERARMQTDGIDAVSLPEEFDEATKLTVYLGRKERVYREPAFIAVCDLLHRRGIAGATTLLGVDGTSHGHRERARFIGRNPDVPMMIIAVGSGEQIARVLPELGGLLRRPLITLERIRVCKRDGKVLQTPHQLPGTDEHGMAMWQKLMIYNSEGALHDGQPIHRAITRQLRGSGASGSTTLRGIWGFHGDHPPHGDRALQLGRHVPTLTIVIDTPERITDSFAIVDRLTTERGLVTSEMVPALRATAGENGRGGVRLAKHRF
jgi:PII-like signaling protein